MLFFTSIVAVLVAGTYAAGSCGVSRNPPSNWRVVGGSNAGHGTWPWQVSLRFVTGGGDQHICGGTIIGDRWVLTAAHCFMGTSDLPSYYPKEEAYYKVRVGEHRQDWYDYTEVDHKVTKILKHYGYNGGNPHDPHDIALIKLSTRIQLSDHVQPVCLNEEQNKYDGKTQDCWITGWGDTRGTADNNHLQQLSGKVWKNTECRNGWTSWYGPRSGWGPSIKSGMVCFGHGDKGACVGDSGGPLVCKKPGTNQYHQVGLTSWGHGDCTEYGKPSVYTRVATYFQWIKSTMSRY